MKKFIFFAIISVFLLLSCIVSDLSADTIIPGGYVSGTWTATGSPYLVQGDITIHVDSTLNIEPDVDVNFQGHYMLTVNGELQAIGTETDSIGFFAADTVIGWKGISFREPGTGQITFSKIQYVRSNEWIVSAIYCGSSGHVTIAHSEIVNNTGYNGGGIWLESSYGANFTISYCTISHNRAGNKGGGIYGGGVGTIEYCVISENFCHGVEVSGGAAYIYSPLDTVIFDHCTFSRNDGHIADGISLGPVPTSHMICRNCIFEGHYGNAIFGPGSTITYCDFFNNGGDVIPIPPGFGDLVQVNTNGDSCDIYGDIFLDPLFEDPDAGNYRITWANWPVFDTTRSSCIDAGNPDSPYDPDGTICDMGAYYYDQQQSAIDPSDVLPLRFSLSQNFPNPFNASTLIKYELPQQSQVTIEVYDLTGRIVKTLYNGLKPAGHHQAIWRADDIASGVYFYKLRMDDYIETRKMTLVK